MTVHRIPKERVRATREVVVSIAPAPANEAPKPRRPSLLDPDFRYVPSGKTDIRKTFARIRREQKEKP